MKKAALLVAILALAGSAFAAEPASVPAAVPPAVESTAKVDELAQAKAQVAELNAAIQMVSQQRDQATAAAQNTQVQLALTQQKLEAAQRAIAEAKKSEAKPDASQVASK